MSIEVLKVELVEILKDIKMEKVVKNLKLVKVGREFLVLGVNRVCFLSSVLVI